MEIFKNIKLFKKRSFKKAVMIVVTAIFILQSTVSTLLVNAIPAQAIVATSQEATDIIYYNFATGTEIKSAAERKLEAAKDSFLEAAGIKALEFFSQTIAIEAATAIASGGKGQKAFFNIKNFGRYLIDVADGAIGTFIETAQDQINKQAKENSQAEAIDKELKDLGDGMTTDDQAKALTAGQKLKDTKNKLKIANAALDKSDLNIKDAKTAATKNKATLEDINQRVTALQSRPSLTPDQQKQLDSFEKQQHNLDIDQIDLDDAVNSAEIVRADELKERDALIKENKTNTAAFNGLDPKLQRFSQLTDTKKDLAKNKQTRLDNKDYPIISFSKGVLGKNKLRFNICQPDFRLGLNISLGLKQYSKPKRPNCTFRQMQQNWKNELRNEDFASRFQSSFTPWGNDLGASLTLHTGILENERNEVGYSDKKRQEGQGFTGLSSIGGNILTPSFLISKLGGDKISDSGKQSKEPSSWATKILMGALDAFSNTLASKTLNKYYVKGLTKLRGEEKRGFSSLSNPDQTSSPFNQSVARADFTQTFKAPTSTGTTYDLVNQFATCPIDQRARGIFNCVIDQDFAQTVNGQNQGLTVKEAMDQGMLHANWAFGYKDPGSSIEPDHLSGYAFSNMKKLRKARIIPIGWELAAKAIDGGNSSYNLEQVINCFEDIPGCPPGGSPIEGVFADENPEDDIDHSDYHNIFWHLVDPNWLLKAPQLKCNALTNGQIIQSGTSDRQEYCTDIQDCISENEDGICEAWGYCTRERNIFRFKGDQCDAQFVSCQTFTRVSDGKEVPYLEDTVNSCEAGSAGCAWYSQTKDNDGNWLDQDRIYFNRNLQECNPEDNGCRKFLRLSGISKVATAVQAEFDRVLADKTATYGPAEEIFLKGTRTSCTEQEVGCEQYTPLTGDPAVNAVGLSQDLCPQECVGFDSFKQESTNFEQADFPVYLIPQTAQACSAAEVGCDQFTNLDEVEKGGEGIEYYSGLRVCQKPGPDSKPYYTWTGSETSGFQLIVFNLKASNLDNGTAPCTNLQASTNICIDSSVPENRALCSKADLTTNPDCREFLDADGNISYRLLSKTILSTEQCIPFRKTTSTQFDCIASGGDWRDTNNDNVGDSCFYNALQQESRACSAQSNGCREYTGNAGRNVAVVVNRDFEDVNAAQVWGNGVERSNESVQRDGHSLKVAASTSLDVSNVLLTNRTYLLSFWAKGSGDLAINFSSTDPFADADPQTPAPRVRLTNDWQRFDLGPVFTTAITANETLTFAGFTGDSFIDNLVLREVQDHIFVIKDSWETPASCEIDPTTQAQVPGFMAGCQEYRDRADNPSYFKSFSRLCSADKVGCEALIDTQNSDSPNSSDANITDQDYDETDLDKVAYVVNDPSKYCASEAKGCQALGLPTLDQQDAPIADKYATVYRVNDPDRYETQLCHEDQLGCEVWQGETEAYFKDPRNKVCEYKEIPNRLPTEFGWFQKGKNAAEPDCELATDSLGERWVKECPAEQSGCTNFINPRFAEDPGSDTCDPTLPDDKDVKTNNCQSNYYIDNDRLDRSCSEVDWKAGCVLFSDVGDIEFDTGATKAVYNSSASPGPEDDAGGPAVPCSKGEPGCDANVILKVQQDRVCAEWLQCQGSMQVFDPQTSALREICLGTGRCTEVKSAQKSECAVWQSPQQTPQVLDKTVYTGRDVSWKGHEYSGLSIPELYPVEELRQIPYSFDDKGKPTDFRLTYLNKNVSNKACNKDDDCRSTNSGDVCFNGKCYDNQGVNGLAKAFDKQCRGYPEPDSPFPSSIANFDDEGVIENQLPLFKRATVCQEFDKEGNPQSCDCSYKKVTYDTGDIRYYNEQGKPDPDFIKPVVEGRPSEKAFLSRVDSFFGWKGYCLEEDPELVIDGDPAEKACLTWMPLDLVQGEVDLFSNAPSASVTFDAHEQYYCAESRLLEFRNTFKTERSTGIVSVKGIVGVIVTIVSVYIFGWVALIADGIIATNQVNDMLTKRSKGYGGPEYAPVRRTGSRSRGYRYIYAPVGGVGYYEYNGLILAEKGPFEVCTAVAKIADGDGIGQSIPWTSRIKNIPAGIGTGIAIPGLPNSDITGLLYGVDQEVSPFGRISPPQEAITEDPPGWTTSGGPAGPLPLAVVNIEGNPAYTAQDRVCRNNAVCCTGNALCLNMNDQCESGPDKGKICVWPATAGSPYACSNIFGQCSAASKVRNSAGKIPYTNTQIDAFPNGITRLNQLFAKSYGLWDWKVDQMAVGVCSGVCQTPGNNNTLQDSSGTDLHCTSELDCIQDFSFDAEGEVVATAITYECKTGVCLGGIKEGFSCTGNAGCEVDPAIKDGLCKLNSDVECIGGPGEKSGACVNNVCDAGVNKGERCSTINLAIQPPVPYRTCQGGPFNNLVCISDTDCSVSVANGVCELVEPYCQALEGGEPVGVFSGTKKCDTGVAAVDCVANGICKPPVNNNGIFECSDKTAPALACENKNFGDSCGSLSTSTNYEPLTYKSGTGAKNLINWDSTRQGKLPVINQVIQDPETRKFSEGGPGFSLGNQTTGNIESVGSRVITARFYAYNPNGEQMPLRQVRVNWGDGKDDSISEGSFKNHKPQCNQVCSGDLTRSCQFDIDCQIPETAATTTTPLIPAQDLGRCVPKTFGDTPDACVEDSDTQPGHFIFLHVYTCFGEESAPSVCGKLDANNQPVTTNCWDPAENVCRFKPSVTVMDNWGFDNNRGTPAIYPDEILITPVPGR